MLNRAAPKNFDESDLVSARAHRGNVTSCPLFTSAVEVHDAGETPEEKMSGADSSSYSET